MPRPEHIEQSVAPMNNKEKKTQIISNECLQPIGNIPRCIDDRDLLNNDEEVSMPESVMKRENFNGPQFLGASLGAFALVAEQMVAEKPDEELVFDAIYDQVSTLHEQAGLELGVHMDDHHGHMTGEDLTKVLEEVMAGKLGDASVIPGCGFAGLLSNEANPLGLSPKVSEFFKKYPNIVDEFYRRGAKLSILANNHAPKENAMAVENLREGVTVDTQKALNEGAQTYNHDTVVLQKVFAPLGESTSAVMEMNRRWLKTTTNILAGMDPVELSV